MTFGNIGRVAFGGLFLLGGLGSIGCGGGSNSAPPVAAPVIATQPANQTVLEGAAATFAVSATGTAPISYQWSKGGVVLPGATSASYTTAASALADSGASFSVTVSNAGGTVASSPAILTVHANPAIASFTATPANLTAGSSATLSFVFTGGTGRIDNGVGAVTSGSSVTVTPAASTTYTLTVDNGFGTSRTATATVTVAAAPTPSVPMQVSLGDAPADWIMTFGTTVSSISLMTAGGTSVNVVPTAASMEMMQLMATMQPVSSFRVPQGSYTQATVTLSAVSMGYMDPVSHAYVQKTMAGPFTATVPFSPAMTVGSSPVALNFDMNMASSVSLDGAGNIAFAPVMTAWMVAAPGTGANPWQGTMQHQVGSVSSFTGTQFTMGSMMGIQTSTFSTNASTVFPSSGLTGMGMMANGMMVAVDASLQADGSYLAQRVEYMGTGSAGMMGGGLVMTVTGNPPTQLTMVANGGMGGGMMASSIAGTMTISLPASVPYGFDADGMDLTNLPFTPAFGPSSLAKGQRVEVVSGSGMMTGGGMMGGGSLGTLTASQLRLEPQALHGVVSAYTATGSQASFTLTLPSESAFTAITGATTIQVYQQAGTQLYGLSAITNGLDVQVRGLLFYDAGTYKLVSNWMTAH